VKDLMLSVSFIKHYITEMIIQIALITVVCKNCKTRQLFAGKIKKNISSNEPRNEQGSK